MNKEDMELKFGDIVQIDPEIDVFGGCFVLVTEVKSWGIQGFVQIPGDETKRGQAYVRKKWEEIEWCGHSVWAPPEDTNA